MTAAAKFRPRFYGSKIADGVYIQPHDNGTTQLAIVKTAGYGWAWGAITEADVAAIDYALNLRGDGDYALGLLKACARISGYPTKREAIESAMKRT